MLFLHFMANFPNFVLKTRPRWVTGWLNPFRKLKMSIMYACMVFFLLTYSTYLELQKPLVFKLQLCPINHQTCRVFWDLGSKEGSLELTELIVHLSSAIQAVMPLRLQCRFLKIKTNFKDIRLYHARSCHQ